MKEAFWCVCVCQVLLAVDGDDRSGSLTIKVATLPEPFKDPADFCMVRRITQKPRP